MICLPPPPSQGRVNMVTAAVGDIRTMILTIGGIGVQPGPFTCPNCGWVAMATWKIFSKDCANVYNP